MQQALDIAGVAACGSGLDGWDPCLTLTQIHIGLTQCVPAVSQHLFNSIDEDGSGTISAQEMKRALQTMGNKIPDVQLAELMKVADQNGDGGAPARPTIIMLFVSSSVHSGNLANNFGGIDGLSVMSKLQMMPKL